MNNNIVEFEGKGEVERQAREWLIRLDGDTPLAAEEVEALREWMNRSPAHRAELTRISKFWRQANVLTELSVPLNRPKGSRANRAWKRAPSLMVASGSLLACMVLIWWGFLRSDGVANGTYGTAIGQQQTLALPDKSTLRLNTDTQVQVAYDRGLRRIRLLRGEVLFTVMPDSSRAFEVYAADGIIRAVGTAFAVHLDGSSVRVTVAKGVVSVSEAAGSRLIEARDPTHKERLVRQLGQLKAGEMTTFGAQTRHMDVRMLAEPELRRQMAWQEGYLVFSGEPLSEVVKQVNRYSPVTLSIADPRLASVAIGGRFRIGDLDAILDVLRVSFGIESRRIDERDIELEPVRGH